MAKRKRMPKKEARSYAVAMIFVIIFTLGMVLLAGMAWAASLGL